MSHFKDMLGSEESLFTDPIPLDYDMDGDGDLNINDCEAMGYFEWEIYQGGDIDSINDIDYDADGDLLIDNGIDLDDDNDGMPDLYEIDEDIINKFPRDNSEISGWQNPYIHNERYALLIGGGSNVDEENFPAFNNDLKLIYPREGISKVTIASPFLICSFIISFIYS